jgi:putative acetyltransferase
MLIRAVRPRDLAAVGRVHREAFGGNGEAGLVAALHAAGQATLSLLGETDDDIVAHVLFSPVDVEHGDTSGLLGLAPVAVRPSHQHRGLGSELVRAGLDAARRAGAAAVVVLGEPAYYARFGFRPASGFGLHDVYGGGDAFMALELQPDALRDCRGRIDYAPAFADLPA